MDLRKKGYSDYRVNIRVQIVIQNNLKTYSTQQRRTRGTALLDKKKNDTNTDALQCKCCFLKSRGCTKEIYSGDK